jgi:4-amino-4-deoxy-L-arabinose transferase-like glycosyltransferase
MSSNTTRDASISSMRRLIDAWFDRAADGSAVAILLALFVAAWTVFHVLAHASLDLHPDIVEAYAWSLHPSAGYYKHPPLSGLVPAAWFLVFPAQDWAFHLLAMVNAGAALFAIDRIARLYVSGDKRLLVLLLLLLTPFYQFHAQRFSTNPMLLSTWPLATWCFLRAFQTRGVAWSAAAGLTAALAMLAKYFSIYLIGACVVAALAHPARWTYLRSPSPWISAAVGLLVLAPHLAWLTSAPYTPFGHVYAAHAGVSQWSVLASVGTYLLGGIGYVALPLAAYAFVVRPDRRLLRETLWPADADRRMLVVLLAAQLLLPALSAPFLRVELTSLWTMQSWFLLPVVLLAPASSLPSPAGGGGVGRGLTRTKAVAVAAAVLLTTVLALVAAPVAAWVKHVNGTRHGEAYYRAISDEVTREWRRHSDRPLRIVMGDLAWAVTFYSPDHPDAVWGFHLGLAPWVTPERVAREGYAIVCDQPQCADEAGRRAAAAPRAIRRDVEVSRRFLGREGLTAGFVILVVPPSTPTDRRTTPVL